MIHYKNLRQAQIAIGITMFLFASFSTAYIQLTSTILSYIVEAEGYTDPVLSNMIVTISSLAQIPACLLGAILGKRMNKKRWCVYGIAFFLLGSLLILPFSRSLTMVLFCRLIVGFGSGLLTLLYTAILPDFYEGTTLSTMLGITTSGGGFWGFVFSNLAANICGAYGWKSAYLLHLYALVPLLLLILLVPAKPLIERTPDSGASGRRGRLSRGVVVSAALGGLLYMGVQVIWSNTSLWVRDVLLGTAAQMGIISGLFSIFSCAARLVFGPVFARLREKTLWLSAAILAAGLFLAAAFTTPAAAFAAAALVGAAMGFTAPACLNMAIDAAPDEQVAAQAITTVGFASGQFLSTMWLAGVGGIFGGGLPTTFLVSACFELLLLVILAAAPSLTRRLHLRHAGKA